MRGGDAGVAGTGVAGAAGTGVAGAAGTGVAGAAGTGVAGCCPPLTLTVHDFSTVWPTIFTNAFAVTVSEPRKGIAMDCAKPVLSVDTVSSSPLIRLENVTCALAGWPPTVTRAYNVVLWPTTPVVGPQLTISIL